MVGSEGEVVEKAVSDLKELHVGEQEKQVSIWMQISCRYMFT